MKPNSLEGENRYEQTFVAANLIFELFDLNPVISDDIWLNALINVIAHCYRSSNMTYEQFQETMNTDIGIMKQKWERCIDET